MGLGLTDSAKLVDQQASGVLLSQPLTIVITAVYVGIGGLNPGPHACAAADTSPLSYHHPGSKIPLCFENIWDVPFLTLLKQMPDCDPALGSEISC